MLDSIIKAPQPVLITALQVQQIDLF